MFLLYDGLLFMMLGTVGFVLFTLLIHKIEPYPSIFLIFLVYEFILAVLAYIAWHFSF